jgi:hypothetical protein
MNPLKFRLPKQEQTDTDALRPRPSELAAWIKALPSITIEATGPLILAIMQHYNRCHMPAAVRLKSLITLQGIVDKLLELLRGRYQNEALPLKSAYRDQADMASRLLDEMAMGFKLVVNDAVTDAADNDMSINLFIAALRLTIDQLGLQLLESYAQYAPPPKGLWGELHRTYELAERNGLHLRVLADNEQSAHSLDTIQHAYLRVALLALTMPNHLMPGQARQIYEYLATWTAGCRMLEKKVTVAETGDIFVDLADERPPAIATGYARFRPVDGRFIDITSLQARLDEIYASIDDPDVAQKGVPLTIAERLRRDLLNRLRKAWQGRAERASERSADLARHYQLCIGLDAAHHFLSGQQDFTPERDEIHYHRPQEKADGLTLLSNDEAPWTLEGPASTNQDGLDDTRLSRFGEEVDVWSTVHQTEIHTRSKREERMAHFRAEPWLCVNASRGGLALRRLPDTLSRTRVGVVVAYRPAGEPDAAVTDDAASGNWQVGILRWLQDVPGEHLDIGVMTLAETGHPVAVRAIGGAGAGGEYFRSLLVTTKAITTNSASEDENDGVSALLVPASIYDIGTQLVLNLQTEIKYVRLIQLLETSNAFSLFAFKEIAVPPAEQARINALGREQR